ncbi:hypothetical protein [Methylomonas fluvii]|nr:hypothetical protein [Methylomonas fluvii]
MAQLKTEIFGIGRASAAKLAFDCRQYSRNLSMPAIYTI